MKPTQCLMAVFGAILLSACGSGAPVTPTIDVNAIYTAAAQTVAVELTQTALAPTSTPEAIATSTSVPLTEMPSVTDTPTATNALPVPTKGVFCDDAKYVADITIPDGYDQLTPGQEFIKTWRVRNTGTCTWNDKYTLVYGYGDDKMNGQPLKLPAEVRPGEEVEVSVRFTAPTKSGEYRGWWRLRNAGGSNFGEFLSVWIRIK